MKHRRKIKVLVVDDSLLFREALAKGLAADPAFEIVGAASDAYQARDLIIATNPDVMSLDVEMPRMSGIEFLRRLMPQHPLRTVVVSSVGANVFEALQAGAVDFVTKPDGRSPNGLRTLVEELGVKIKIASGANVSHWRDRPGTATGPRTFASELPVSGTGRKLVAIGASTGGTEAIMHVLSRLPVDSPGIVVVQHMPPVFTRMFAERLNQQTLLTVKEAETGDVVRPGTVLLAPGDRHMRVKATGSQWTVECQAGEKVSGHCPSVNILFESVAAAAGKRALGLILTGMGSDGAAGLLAMRRSGAATLGQDEKSSVVYGMPQAAYAAGAVERQAPLTRMAGLVEQWAVGGA